MTNEQRVEELIRDFVEYYRGYKADVIDTAE